MTSLREPDVHAVLRLVGDAHHADDLDDFRALLLASLPEIVPTDYISYNEVSQVQGPGVAIVAARGVSAPLLRPIVGGLAGGGLLLVVGLLLIVRGSPRSLPRVRPAPRRSRAFQNLPSKGA